jgi:outer membrane protein assembly factor BamB
MRVLSCITLALVVGVAHAGDWPQWLGPNRDGTSPEIVKPWTESPKVLWRVAVGDGHSSPVVANGLVYLFFKVAGKDAETLAVYDGDTGKELKAVIGPRPPFNSPFGAGPRATSSVASNHQVISVGVTGILAARPGLVVRSPGAAQPVAWTADMATQFHAPIPKFGVSASPLVDGNRVFVLAGGKGASLIAFELLTGKVLWKALDDPPSYASPMITDHGGKRQLVALTGDAVVSLDPTTGELLWRHPFRDVINESSTTPIRVGDLIVASSVTLGSVGLKLETKDGKPAVTVAWMKPALCCYFSTPVVVDKYLYMVTGSLVAAIAKKPESTLNCVEAATGKVLWSKPNVGKYHAALIRTGDNKLLMHSDTGDLVMIDPDPKEYRELARATICGQTWAHPALANGRLYVRDNKELICLKLGD